LQPNQEYHLAVAPSTGDGRSSAAITHSVAWGVLPATVITDCGETSYKILVTAPQHYDIAVAYQAIALTTVCEQCLAGTWELDNNSYLNLARSIQPDQGEGEGFVSTLDSVEGIMQLTFTPGTHAFESQMGMSLVSTTEVSGVQLNTLVEITGGYQGTYSTSQDLLLVSNSGGAGQVDVYNNGNLLMTFDLNGGDASTQAYLDAFGAQGGNVHFVCSGDSLAMEPGQPLLDINPSAPWLQFNRASTLAQILP
ncbi:MAG TPA: hypothetical protein VLK33_09375, partial [Terriglobales bacterium]|nr:hypothetical protein [Terriglobales bacterium]